MRGPFRPRTAEDVDRVVSAEIPDPVQDPELYQVVVDCMCMDIVTPVDRAGKMTSVPRTFPRRLGRKRQLRRTNTQDTEEGFQVMYT